MMLRLLLASLFGASLLVAPAAYAQETPIQTTVTPTGPSVFPAEDGDRIPRGYTPVERTRTGAIVGGAVMFGTMYFFTALGAAVANDTSSHSADPLYLPGIGPFVQAASVSSDTGKFFLVVDGVTQTAGLALLIYGLSSKKTVFVRNDLVVAPMLSASTAGAAVAGRF